jgi:hypothetical protein
VRRHLAPTLLLCACATSVPPDETDTDAARKTDLVAANDLVVVADTPAPVDAAVVLDAPALPDVAPPRDLPVVMDLPALPDVQRVDALVDVPPRADIVDAPAVLDAPRACGEALPAGWPTGWSVAGHNPVLVAARGSALQGRDNVYAPEIHRDGALWVMWYGAQASDGGDRIHVAVSRDGVTWRRHPRDDAPAAALERGSSNHVNDPSVVRAGDRWRMYYTDAPTAENDRIWLAESTSLTGFTRVREVLAPGAPGAWDAEKVGRPAVLLENGVYRMWYDGTRERAAARGPRDLHRRGDLHAAPREPGLSRRRRGGREARRRGLRDAPRGGRRDLVGHQRRRALLARPRTALRPQRRGLRPLRAGHPPFSRWRVTGPWPCGSAARR